MTDNSNKGPAGAEESPSSLPEQISVAEAHSLIERRAATVIDVRERGPALGYIPGATFIPLDDLKEARGKLPASKDPTSIPNMPKLANQASACEDTCHSSRSEGSMKPTIVTPYAASSQEQPDSRIRRKWNRPKRARSMCFNNPSWSMEGCSL